MDALDAKALRAATAVLVESFRGGLDTPLSEVDWDGVLLVAFLHRHRAAAFGEGPDTAAFQCAAKLVTWAESTWRRRLIGWTSPPVQPALLWTWHASTLTSQTAVTGAYECLEQALALGRAAAGATRVADPDRPIVLYELSLTLRAWFAATDDTIAAVEAVDNLREVVRITSQGHEFRAGFLAGLCNMLMVRSERNGSNADLDDAIEAGEAALVAMDLKDSARDVVLNHLGNCFDLRALRSGRDEDLDAAVSFCQASVATTERAGADVGVLLADLARTLQVRGIAKGRIDDLEAARTVAERSLAAMPPDDIRRSLSLNALGAIDLSQYELTAEPDALDRAVDRLADAVTRAGSADRWHAASNLGLAHMRRFERAGLRNDADMAIQVYEHALGDLASDHPERHTLLNGLGTALLCLARHTHLTDDMERALHTLRQALAGLPPGHWDRGLVAGNLASALLEMPGYSDEAVELAEESVRAAEGNVLRLPAALSTLVECLLDRYRAHGGDLSDALEYGRRAWQLVPDGHHAQPRIAIALGETLAEEIQRAGLAPGGPEAREALELFRQVARQTHVAAWLRLAAAARGARLATEAGEWPDALAAYDDALKHLATAAWHGHDFDDRLHALRDGTALAADAAATALHADDPTRAVALLEQGRGLLLSQSLDAGTNRQRVHRFAPGLALRMDTVRARLEDDRGADPSTMLPMPGYTAHHRAVHRRELAREWDELVRCAQAVPELSDFLRPITYADLTGIDDSGPVVYINISQFRCDAIVIADGAPPQFVPLGGNAKEWTERAEKWLDALHADREGSVYDWHKATNDELNDLLAWLHKVAVAPVLAALPGRNGAWRIWWCPVGPAVFLPLHAAAAIGTDHVISSYVPTLRALLMARQQTRPEADRVLAVAVPGAGARRLRHAVHDVERLKECVEVTTELIGSAASRRRLLDELPGHSVWHFSGHGHQHAGDPRSAALYTDDYETDGPLTLHDIAQLDLRRGFLAFVSACESARGTRQLMDESVHICGALQLAGYTHVIGTQWTILDRHAPQVTYEVYRRLAGAVTGSASQLSFELTAPAVDAAVRGLRSEGVEALCWASYVHIGP
ncbi:CHAT domain-containing protein [Streptomyces sp. NPDC058202]|uniref:CHAT domain-containing protein n=1 Tax=Streptomyces sp. NPDC058202 TaxID=3346380 RepID=UPI0036EC7EFA